MDCERLATPAAHGHLCQPTGANTMKSLPTLLSTKALKALLATLPPAAIVTLTASTCVVKAPNGVKIIRAIKAPRHAQWHVMALEGMIEEVAA